MNPAKKAVLMITVMHLNTALPAIVIVIVLVAKMMLRKSKSQKIMSQKVQKVMMTGINAVTGPLSNNSTLQFVGVLDMGGPSQRYQDGTSPSDLVELVLDGTFLD